MNQDILRKLPSIDELMKSPEIASLASVYGRDTVVGAARLTVDRLRSGIMSGDDVDVSADSVASRVSALIKDKFTPSLRHGVNAAGIVLHTGLGRAMLPESAVDAIQDVIRGYCTLTTDIETGQRGSRDVHISDLLCELTGAEAATVVNNNAAATMIILNTMAKGKEVIVSRGQLVEIGGSFRMPDVMEMSGATLKEVGTTNKTHLRDYANAINENTGAILRVHQSNYRIVGFTEEPSIQDLAVLARKHGLPVIDDLGSGALVDLAGYGVEPEPMMLASVQAGADAVCFSGDKLIGGPQCGIIVGKSEWITKIKKNPLARALRVDKMTVAGLEATLRLFLNPERLNEDHPTYRMLSLSPAAIEPRAQSVAEKLRKGLGDSAVVEVTDGTSQVGSGSVAAETLPTRLLSIRPKHISADSLARNLRRWREPIFARIHRDAVLFDFRTIQPDEDALVADGLLEILTHEVIDQ